MHLHDVGEELGIVRELRRVLEREAGGSSPITGHDERGDLVDLPLAASPGARLLRGEGDVSLGMFDRAHLVRLPRGHVATLRGWADLALTSR